MKKDIHPEFYPEAKVACACGASHTVGSVMPEISVEICSACHPFYTGNEKILDTAGRVEKFKAKMAAASGAPKKAKKSTKKEEVKEEKIEEKAKEVTETVEENTETQAPAEEEAKDE